MLSFYIHIPFCKTKCPYCSFQVCPTDQMKSDIFFLEIEKYVDGLISEISNYAQILDNKAIGTIYFGGGTPQLIGVQNIQRIVDTIIEHFDTESLAEFSIEMNPYPQQEVYEFIKILNSKYKQFPRIRFSFGIQSFDNKVLSESGRDITFPGLVDFFRGLQKLKKDINVFNLDFIAFGHFNQSKKGNLQLRNQNTLEFFNSLAKSQFIDSYSVYTLELFPGSLWYYQKKDTNTSLLKGGEPLAVEGLNPSSFTEQLPLKKGDIIHSSDDDIYEEFSILKDMLFDNGYKRYELSNFALMSKSSIHNRVYREMGDYIGLGTSASSFIKNPNEKLKKYLSLDNSVKAVRRTNTDKIPSYNQGEYFSKESVNDLSLGDLLIEEFFLSLRTDKGIQNIDDFKDVLSKDYKQKIQSYRDQGFIEIVDNSIKLTDQGMDIYNDIITELLEII